MNPTLGGYLNKIFQFLLNNYPEEFLKYMVDKQNFIESLFNHLYLSTCLTDIVVVICTIPDIKGFDMDEYESLRSDIIQFCINSID